MKPSRLVAFAACGLGAAVVLILFNVTVAALRCSADNTYCAASTQKNGVYRGVVLGPGRSPAANTDFTVKFQSREGEDPVGFTTGADGSFCIRWADESVTPTIQENELAIQDGDFAEDRRLTGWKEVSGGPQCQDPADAAIPWNRAETLHSSWQYAVMMGLAAGAALLMLLALLRPGLESSLRVLQTAYVLLGLALVAAAAGWIV